jgi:hypothetical protein
VYHGRRRAPDAAGPGAAEFGAEDIAPWLESAPESEETAGLRGEIERREADAIRKALEAANWNVTQAAAGLGIDRTPSTSFRVGLCRSPLSVALLRLAPAPCPASKIPRRFGRINIFHWYYSFSRRISAPRERSFSSILS